MKRSVLVVAVFGVLCGCIPLKKESPRHRLCACVGRGDDYDCGSTQPPGQGGEGRGV